MNLSPNCLCLVICVLIHVTNEEMTTGTDTLNKAKITDTINKINDPNLKENINIDEKKEHQTGSTQFDMKDFKVNKLKSHHFEDEDTADCLANVDPAKIEAVKKSIRNNDGRVEYVPADPQHVNDEDIKIINCLKREVKAQITQTTNSEIKKINKEATDATVKKINLSTVEEENTPNQKPGRRDTEYQFEPLDYYDDEMVFDNTTCPDKVEVIELQLGEVKNYDLECSMITHWTGLSDADQMYR
ncbi:uncharacterized protein LOC133525824 [Cydia pomonella]|uniref:uncharacterized protein LOC133525824 n=1 Tax=Cydia pomonella TaxID=82600 RepID=UPI002ADE5556|nr:uncharacterized protein LOC133525824 [Cydia pomonella]